MVSVLYEPFFFMRLIIKARVSTIKAPHSHHKWKWEFCAHVLIFSGISMPSTIIHVVSHLQKPFSCYLVKRAPWMDILSCLVRFNHMRLCETLKHLCHMPCTMSGAAKWCDAPLCRCCIRLKIINVMRIQSFYEKMSSYAELVLRLRYY